MQSYISYRRGRIFNSVTFFLFLPLPCFITKNIGDYRKYDIFYNFPFTENMIFPVKCGKSRQYDIYAERFYENVIFHAAWIILPYVKDNYEIFEKKIAYHQFNL